MQAKTYKTRVTLTHVESTLTKLNTLNSFRMNTYGKPPGVPGGVEEKKSAAARNHFIFAFYSPILPCGRGNGKRLAAPLPLGSPEPPTVLKITSPGSRAV
jgi:hypothetical protein